MMKKKRPARFDASKREFLKRMTLLGVYIGPLIRTFEMAEIAGKPTGPPKKQPTRGTVRLDRLPESPSDPIV